MVYLNNAYGYTYTGTANAIVAYPSYERVSISWSNNTTRPNESKETSLTTDKLIESLFRLNPKAKEKYEGDKGKFAAAIVAAAEAVEQRNALADLTDLGLAE